MDEFEHRCDASLDLAGWSKRFGILNVLSTEQTTGLGLTCGVWKDRSRPISRYAGNEEV